MARGPGAKGFGTRRSSGDAQAAAPNASGESPGMGAKSTWAQMMLESPVGTTALHALDGNWGEKDTGPDSPLLGGNWGDAMEHVSAQWGWDDKHDDEPIGEESADFTDDSPGVRPMRSKGPHTPGQGPEAQKSTPAGLQGEVTLFKAASREGEILLLQTRQKVAITASTLIRPRPDGLALLLPGDIVRLLVDTTMASTPATHVQWMAEAKDEEEEIPMISPQMAALAAIQAAKPRTPTMPPPMGSKGTKPSSDAIPQTFSQGAPAGMQAPGMAVPRVTDNGDATDGTRHSGTVKVWYADKGFGFLYGDAYSEMRDREVYFKTENIHPSVAYSRHEGEELLQKGEEVEFYITAITTRGPVATCITLAGYNGVLPASPGLLPENEFKGDADSDTRIGCVKMFNAQRKFGFVREKLDKRFGGTTRDFYFSVADVEQPHIAGLAILLPGDVVSFSLVESDKGFHAVAVRYLRAEKDLWSDDDDDE